jgi:hypothetical protein
MVNEVVVVGLVEDAVDASADFGQQQHAEEFVLDPDGLPRRGWACSAMRSVNGSG